MKNVHASKDTVDKMKDDIQSEVIYLQIISDKELIYITLTTQK